jgi:hypothetical protein
MYPILCKSKYLQEQEKHMTDQGGARLRYGKALGGFALTYIVSTVVSTAFCFAVEAAMHISEPVAPMSNPAYLLAERFLPLLNLLIWMGGGWFYLHGRSDEEDARRQALRLGVLWLALVVVVDYVGFVLIKNPISLSPHDFYIGQFPWIYLIYVAVLVGPWCFAVLAVRTRIRVESALR